MSQMEEIEAAEARMNTAKEVLLKYVEKREDIDRDRYHRLAARLKKAEADFLQAVSELDK